MTSNKTSHLATGRARPASHPSWAPVAKSLMNLALLLSGRDDLRVVIAPGAAGPAPGSFNTRTAVIELDADMCFAGTDPNTIRVARGDAGVLDSTGPDIIAAKTALRRALGKGMYDSMEAIWRAALGVADTDKQDGEESDDA